MRSLILYCCFALAYSSGQAQSVSISYPTNAGVLTRGYSSSALTVRLSYSTACSGGTVTIALPADVQYVAGSIVKTAGTDGTSATTITQSNIANLRRPVFAVGAVSGAGDITFTITRIANCGTSSSGKDSVYVTGACGTASETNGSTNTYNISTPALTQSSPTPIANAVINQQYTRIFRITNGGEGWIDTLRLAVKRPASLSGGIIQLRGATLTPFTTSGDTSFYKIAGADLPGGDGLMVNGESLDFTEQFVLMDCASLTETYLASWGRPGNTCVVTTTNSTITMATGSANITATTSRSQQMNWCRNGVFSITFINNAAIAGGKANAAYSLLGNIGYNATGNSTVPVGITNTGFRGRIDSVKIGAITVPLTPVTTNTPTQARFAGLATDPDGAGVGLDDLDGDGQYDDLPPGKSVTVTVYEHWDNSITNSCNSNATTNATYGFFNSYTATYSSMCGTVFTTNPLPLPTSGFSMGAYRILANNNYLTTPAEVAPNTPFVVQACVNLSSYSPPFSPKDSLYFDIVLPPGLSPAPIPNITYNGTAIAASAYYMDTVLTTRTLHIRTKGRASAFCYSLSLVYDCSSGNTFSPQFNIRYQGDSCSTSIDYHMCRTATIRSSCLSPCIDGIRNYLPVAKRLTLGYTDVNLTTKVAPSAVTGLAAYTALALDTVQIIVPGKQLALTGLGSFNNLYYNLQFGRSGNADVFQFVSGTFNQVSGGVTTSNAMAAPTNTTIAATASIPTGLQRLSWNLSPNLNNGTISTNDSVWLDLRLVVTRANTDALYANTLTQVPYTSSSLYNLTVANLAVGCDTAHAINLLLTGNASTSNYTAPTTLSSCGSATITSSQYFGNSTGLDIFPAEYRPQVIIDSVQITLPAGYVLSTSYNQYNSRNWASLVTYGSNPTSAAGTITQILPTTWTLRNPYLSSGGWTLSDLGNVSLSNYSINYQISPTCAVVVGSQIYSQKWFYHDFVYTGNPSVYANKTYTYSGASLIYNATVVPALTLQNNTGTVQGVLAQHYWDVQLNSSGNATPPYNWLALDRLNSGISIDSVVYDGTNITANGAAYSTNKTWFQLSATGIASGTSKAARIYFKYTNCTADSIKILAGWNCTGYPSPDPSANTCNEISQFLKVVPQSSQVQLSLLRQPGNGSSVSLCAMDSVSATVNSADPANVANPIVSITPPAGMALTAAIPVEYPLGSGNWQSLTPVINAGVYTINLKDHTGIGATGLKGVAAAAGVTANRQAKVVVQYSVNCSFVANSLIAFNVYGSTPCGSTAVGNGNRVNSGSVAITGASVAGSASMDITAAKTTFSCGDAASNISLNVIPLGGVATTSGDVAVYSLPAGLNYVANSFAPGSNCAGCTIATAAGSGGTTDLSVSLAQNVASGTTMSFTIQVQPGSAGGCGGNITGSFRRNTAALTCGGTTCNSSQAIIASTFQAITIKKPQLDITSLTSVNNCYATANYLCSYNLSVKNNGTVAAAANTYKAEFFCTGNATPLYEYTLANALAVGASSMEMASFSVPLSCYGKQLSVKISPVTVSGVSQCMCNESSNQLAIVLPLKLLSFEATLKNNSVNLSWKVSDEKAMKHYEVERSLDGVSFSSITQQPATNNSTNTTAYEAVDKQLPLTSGTLYYRLKMVAANGGITHSAIAIVHLPTGGAVTELVMPNPATNLVKVILPVNAGLAQIRLLNVTGQVMVQQPASGGINSINISMLSKGIYQLQVVRMDGTIHLQKIVKE